MSAPTKLDFFEVGDKASLICADRETTGAVERTLQELGFKFHTAETMDAAIERIRYTSYDCIILQETFSGSALRTNAALKYLAGLPMSQRRNAFVCLIGPSFETLDAMQAFAQSVHVVINPADLPNFGPIMKKSLAEFDQLYRVYKETAAALGEK